ncbi:MAG: chemotaxis protein [Desulfovibrio sp.]|nr:chemotaxis protein [Desulfovibrio sp.]
MDTISIRIPLFLLLLSCVGGCGPKDIGEGTSADTAQPQGVSVEDRLRYPVFGANNTQRMLYWQNRPDVMANVQQWQRMQLLRNDGHTPVSPEDPRYRAIPKERSPFRQ